MSTNTIVATRPVEITDTTLLSFHNQREIAYKGTKQQIDSSLPGLKSTMDDIALFRGTVRERGKVLQEERVKVPSKSELDIEKEEILEKYKGFKDVYEKTGLLAENILRTITFLTPVQRQWSVEKSLQEETPLLYAQTKRSEEICLGYIAELSLAHTQVQSLRSKLLTEIHDPTLTWSLQRFCGIVDNEGKPLPWYNRAANYVSPYLVTPTIPKPKGKEVNETSTGAKNNDTGSTSSTPLPNPLVQQRDSSNEQELKERELLPTGTQVSSNGTVDDEHKNDTVTLPTTLAKDKEDKSPPVNVHSAVDGKKLDDHEGEQKETVVTGMENLSKNQRKKLKQREKKAASLEGANHK